jgi:molybdenum cofactor synthesis domain-containing protein
MRIPGDEALSAKTAGIIVIGNEVLSGKVSDINSTWLIAELRPLGVRIARVVMVPDEIPVIVEQMRLFSGLFDVVFTTGGVGPTHDDKTFEAAAVAFDAPLEKSAELERVIAEYFKDTQQSDLYMRMSLVPRGTELVFSPGLLFPVTKLKNLYILPGDPKVMKKKFTAIRELFRETPFHIRRVFTSVDEGPIAAIMGEIEKTMGIDVGSYPVYDNPDYKVQITLESKDPALVEAALAKLLASIAPEHVVRID